MSIISIIRTVILIVVAHSSLAAEDYGYSTRDSQIKVPKDLLFFDPRDTNLNFLPTSQFISSRKVLVNSFPGESNDEQTISIDGTTHSIILVKKKTFGNISA